MHSTDEEHQFQPFPKIPRLSRDIIITEKIDGTNAQIYVAEDGTVKAGSRNRWITPEDDNFGFARWVKNREFELATALGIGRHYGEWWGYGIQRGYGLVEKRFTLFNPERYSNIFTPHFSVVPILYQGIFDLDEVWRTLNDLHINGSRVAPGFKDPEGVVIYHKASGQLFKKTIKDDHNPKGN